jgi:heparosan-N-sulfate-glucuronate 5-epimerase
MKLPFFIVQLWRGLKVIFGVSKFHHKISVNGFNNETLYPLDLTDKLSFFYFEIDGVPKVKLTDGVLIGFPIHQAQIALAHWDCHIKHKDEAALKKFIVISEALISQVDDQGKIDTWSKIRPGSSKYSSMTQSLVASVVLRYELLFLKKEPTQTKKIMNSLVHDECFKNPLNGGLEEIPESLNPCVLNGWLYSLFIFFEYEHIHSDVTYRAFLSDQLSLLEKVLPSYLCSFGTYYDLGSNYASPFYHDLHIKQFILLNEATNNRFDDFYSELIKRNRSYYKAGMIFIKGLQKLREPIFNEIQG